MYVNKRHLGLDESDQHADKEVRELIPGNARITDLHVWRLGPEAHAAIVSAKGTQDSDVIRQRLGSVRERAQLTVEVR